MLAFLIFFNICLALQAIKHVSAQPVKPESSFCVATEPSRFFFFFGDGVERSGLQVVKRGSRLRA